MLPIPPSPIRSHGGQVSCPRFRPLSPPPEPAVPTDAETDAEPASSPATLRPARPDDAAAVSAIHRLAAFVTPPGTVDDNLRFVREQLMAKGEVWLAQAGGAIVGYVAFDDGWIAHLMVRPDHQGRGHGAALLAHAMADGRPRQLWTYARNAPARRFYERHGWTLAETTDGHEPEVRYVSPPPAPRSQEPNPAPPLTD